MNKLDPSGAMDQQNLMNQFDALQTCLQNRALTAAGLTIGSVSTTKVKIANTVTFLNAGVFHSKATAEVAFTASTHDIQAKTDSVQEAMYLLCLDGSGTASITKGATSTGAGTALLPEIPAGLTPIASVRIAVAAGSTNFTAGTSNLSDAQLTVTYKDLGWVSPRFDAAQ